MVRKDDWAEPSLAARREASRFGIAMAAIMPMIATTIRSSISEKPLWVLVLNMLLILGFVGDLLLVTKVAAKTSAQALGVIS
jgi:hypothetical protein